MVFGSVVAGSVSAFSSSERPFVNDLMPFAKSPISSEILPRPPNSKSPTARTRIQCQTLIEPICKSSVQTGRTGPGASRALWVTLKLGARCDKNKDFAHARRRGQLEVVSAAHQARANEAT